MNVEIFCCKCANIMIEVFDDFGVIIYYCQNCGYDIQKTDYWHDIYHA